MNTSSFSERNAAAQDVPFIVDSFAGSYVKVGHVGGLHDKFREMFKDPFRALVLAACEVPNDLVAARVVFPVTQPTEIAGYAVFSPRYATLVYLLTKPAYAGFRVGAHLLATMPTIASTETRDPRPVIQHCFSTAAFAKMCKAMDARTRYSPFMFERLCREITEEHHGRDAA